MATIAFPKQTSSAPMGDSGTVTLASLRPREFAQVGTSITLESALRLLLQLALTVSRL